MFDPLHPFNGFRQLHAPDSGGGPGSSLPVQSEVAGIAQVLKEAASLAHTDSDPSRINSVIERVDEVELRGALRFLSRTDRIKIAQDILPLMRGAGNGAARLMALLLESSRSLVDLTEVVHGAGLDRSESISDKGRVSRLVGLARCATDIKDESYLPDPCDLSANQLLHSIATVGDVLRHNAELCEAQSDTLSYLPFAVNARLLSESFEAEKFRALNQVDSDPHEARSFIDAWSERVKVHTQYGIGIYCDDDLSLCGEELSRLRQGIFRFPPSMLLLDNMVLRVDFTDQPAAASGALANSKMKIISLYPALREAASGVDSPDNIDPYAYVAVRELALCLSTKCHAQFREISGWTRIRSGEITDPMTKQAHQLAPGEIEPGSVITLSGISYKISPRDETRQHEFPLGFVFGKPASAEGDGWAYRAGSTFVNDRAAVSPFYDYAESLAYALFLPRVLERASPERARFMKYVFGLVGSVQP